MTANTNANQSEVRFNKPPPQRLLLNYERITNGVTSDGDDGDHLNHLTWAWPLLSSQL
jgi:hypothetical protein